MTETEKISVGEFVDDVVDTLLGAVVISVLCEKRRSFYLGGWSLHQEEILNRKIVRKYIEYYSGRSIEPFRITIPGIKNLKRPKKPK